MGFSTPPHLPTPVTSACCSREIGVLVSLRGGGLSFLPRRPGSCPPAEEAHQSSTSLGKCTGSRSGLITPETRANLVLTCFPRCTLLKKIGIFF